MAWTVQKKKEEATCKDINAKEVAVEGQKFTLFPALKRQLTPHAPQAFYLWCFLR